jgi:copper chaperone CopZ
MKNIIIILLLTFGISAQAQQKSKNAKHTILVSGNCEQCKKRIEKAAFSVNGVKSADWSIETQQLSLILNEEKTSPADVKKAVAKLGHDSEETKATDLDYENLHHCCKYDRK